MRIGVVGLKNAGKSTLFDVLISHRTASRERTGESRHGVMVIPDERLEFLQKATNAKKQVHPSFEIIDLPPMRKIKSSMESDSTKILEETKYCDALIQVVRQFTNPAVPYEQEGLDQFGEKSTLDAELIFIDLMTVENRINRIEKMKHKVHDFYQPGEPELLQRCRETLEKEAPLSILNLDSESEKLLRGFRFLSIKPRITVINVDETEIANYDEWIDRFENRFPLQKGTFEAICCQAEGELLDLPEDEREEFRQEFGLDQPAVKVVTERLMKTMNLIRFLTATEQAAQSWIIPAGTPAQKAAGIIHTDIERGFIRAEVVTYDDYVRCGNIAQCKEEGCFRLEGKEYIVQESDVCFFRFNV